ncbi:DUF2934 domain-containing protein [Sphingomonas sp. AP4-R1]|uniref:DUF2934 domain-containing protein n=1 Tax=Sphingomonas sp. AP4-R1 TaxID=2735134 RepID=UPI001C1286FE
MSDSKQDQKIRERAYQIWEAEGRPHGRHEQHWQDALREIATTAGDAVASVTRKVRRAVKKVADTVSDARETPAASVAPAPKKQTPTAKGTRKRQPKASPAAVGTTAPTVLASSKEKTQRSQTRKPRASTKTS